MKKMDRLYFILTYMFFIYPPFIMGLVSIYADYNSNIHITSLLWNIVVVVVISIICTVLILLHRLHAPDTSEIKYLIFGFIGNIMMYLYTFQVDLNIQDIITIYLVLLVVLFVFYLLISNKLKPLELWILLPIFLIYDYLYVTLSGCGWDSSGYCLVNYQYIPLLHNIYTVLIIFIVLYYVYKITLYRLLDFFKVANIIIVIALSYMLANLEVIIDEVMLTFAIMYPFFIIVDFIVKLVNKNYSHKMLLFYIRTFAIFIIFSVLSGTDYYEGTFHREVLSIMVTITYFSLFISILKTLLNTEVKDENPITVIQNIYKGPKFKEVISSHIPLIAEQYNETLADHVSLGDNVYSLVVQDPSMNILGFISTYTQYLPAPLENTKEAFINVIEVNVDYRNQGIASKLIKMTEQHFKSQGVMQIRAWSSIDKYEAIHMWQKLGYSLSPATIHIEDKNINVEGFYAIKKL